MLQKNNQFMEGFRKRGLRGLKEFASSSGDRTLEPLSFEDAVMSSTGFQIADAKVQQACSAKGHAETVDDTDTVSSGSLSRWEGGLELDFAEEEVNDVGYERMKMKAKV